MMFNGSPADAIQTGKYPNFVSAAFSSAGPWQRSQFSTGSRLESRPFVRPTPLIPTTEVCEGRIAGGAANDVTAASVRVWQSTQVACRFY